jgi:hypothetical protein
MALARLQDDAELSRVLTLRIRAGNAARRLLAQLDAIQRQQRLEVSLDEWGR